MPEETQPTGFFNRASVVLFFVFMIPATLTLAGTYYVAQTGRVPGGEDSTCTRALTSETDLRVDIYDYVAGLVDFETQTVFVRSGEDEWQELFSDTIPVPQTLTCDNAARRLDDQNIVIQNQKSLAWSNDNGVTWATHNVCDEPRPQRGRCDAEALSLATINLDATGNGTLTVIESAVDEFGEPQRDANGNPVIDEQWQVVTVDYGDTWSLLDSE